MDQLSFGSTSDSTSLHVTFNMTGLIGDGIEL